MNMSPTAAPASTPSPLRVLALGLLMGGSIALQPFANIHIAINLQWYLPLLAAWLAHRHGVAVLRAWWPLAFLPRFNVTLLDGLNVGFSLSATTLLLAVLIGAAVDPRCGSPALAPWLRRNWRWPAIGAFCLLVAAGIDHGTIKLGIVRLNALALIPALTLLAVIRWEALARAVRPDLGLAPGRVLGLVGGLFILSGLVLDFSLRSEPANLSWAVGFGTLGAANLVPILCFALVLSGEARVRAITVLLFAGLVIDRLLALPGNGGIGPIGLDPEWQMLNWPMFLGSIAAAWMGRLFAPFLKDGAFRPPLDRRGLAGLLGGLLLLLVGSPLLGTFGTPAYGTSFWLIAAIAFAAGVRWRARSLLFLVPLLQALWLFAASVTGLRNGDASTVAAIGLVAFPYALCGTFFSLSRALSPLVSPRPSPSGSSARGPIAIADLSALAAVVEQIERSGTWRSFFVAAVPFVLIWQFYELYAAARLFGQAGALFGDASFVEGWHIALAALLLLIPPAFVLWDWIDRRDALRPLALINACAAGGIVWFAIGGLVTLVLLAAFELHQANLNERLPFISLFAFAVFTLAAGLLGGDGSRLVRRTFLSCMGLVATASLAALVWAWTALDQADFIRLLGALIISAALAYAISRFVRLRLLLAGDWPRRLLFGALGGRGFWARMAAAAGLPSSLWHARALREPAFWALFCARFVVYTGGVLARQWAMSGAAVIALGHLVFHAGKRLGAREIWRPRLAAARGRHTLFLRGFDDDQCEFRRPGWNLLARWLDLWSFRRNLDEAMIDEIAHFGAVVALGRPGDRRTPFGAMRHYSADEDWQRTLADAARAAQAIVLVASNSPGVQWEYDLLAREGMLDKVLLLFRPGADHAAANRHAAAWYRSGGEAAVDDVMASGRHPIGMRCDPDGTVLFAADRADAAAYVLGLRLHFGEHGLSRPGDATPALAVTSRSRSAASNDSR